MYCDEALNAVEAVAAGDATPDGRLAAHYETCPDCSAALAGARQVELLLRQRPVPKPPASFTSRTLASVRRARWRSEQVIDFGFNVVIAVVVLAIVGGVWMVLNRSGLTAVSNEALRAAVGGFGRFAEQIGPSLPL